MIDLCRLICAGRVRYHWREACIRLYGRRSAKSGVGKPRSRLDGKLMEDSGSVSAIASFMTEPLGPRRAVLSVL
jgi:hypothetical protein